MNLIYDKITGFVVTSSMEELPFDPLTQDVLVVNSSTINLDRYSSIRVISKETQALELVEKNTENSITMEQKIAELKENQ